MNPKLKFFALFIFSSSISSASSATPPSTCKVEVILSGYPTEGCIVTNPLGLNQDLELPSLQSTLALVPGGACQDLRNAVGSFQHCITNDSRASSCKLTYWSDKGCTGDSSTIDVHKESEYLKCTTTAFGGFPAVTRSMYLRCR